MKFTADFHVHSRFSAATSPDLTIHELERMARKKGVDVISTGDFTHPLYFKELQENLEEVEPGLYRLKKTQSPVRFILTVEMSNIFFVNGRERRIHTIVFAPGLEIASQISQKLSKWANLGADGRPAFRFHVKELMKRLFEVSSDLLFVPAHVWTPWYSIFGSEFGFDSVEECFEEETKNIFALETGLCSDPSMNRRVSKLDSMTLLSNSDAHSAEKVGREANVFDCEKNYFEILDVIKKNDPERFLYTVEFFPEEGKYFWDGHKACKVSFDPQRTCEHDYLCPKCGKKLIIGAAHRVEKLADREIAIKDSIPFKNIVPLEEIIASAMGRKSANKMVEFEYEKILSDYGSEFHILTEMTEENLKQFLKPEIAEGILAMRKGEVTMTPGYDGVYGAVHFPQWAKKKTEQLELF